MRSFDPVTARVPHRYTNEGAPIVTDSTPAPRSNDPANDGYEIRIAEEARREKQDEAREAGGAEDDKAHAGEEILDAIEDTIPGDSDNDGH